MTQTSTRAQSLSTDLRHQVHLFTEVNDLTASSEMIVISMNILQPYCRSGPELRLQTIKY